MPTLDLYSRDGYHVVTVAQPPTEALPEVVQWGNRHFALRPDGRYREVKCWYVHTAYPAEAAGKPPNS